MSNQHATVLHGAIVKVVLFCLALLSLGISQAYAMGGGMMGGGMMGGSQNNTAVAAVNPAKSEALLGYIKHENLACSQCHTVSHAAVGPAFALIATNYARQKDAEQVLSRHIAHGFRNMPAGLATESQAKQLAQLIMELYSK